MDASKMTKAQLVDLVSVGLAAEVVRMLPDRAEMTPAQNVKAREALVLAAGIDAGEDLATAAHHKQFREILAELEVMADGDSDEASEFWRAMQTEMGH